MGDLIRFPARSNPQSEGSSALYPQPAPEVIHNPSPESPAEPKIETPPYVVVVVDDVVVDGVERAAPSFPQEQGTTDLRRELEREMGRIGVCYRARFFRIFQMEDIALSLEDVREAMNAAGGKKIANPAGLFVRVLEDRAGRKAFR
jgi:hypothetical protein